ncbi:ferritin [candidate division KSB1 bacterium]
MEDAFNKHLNKELFSAYLYLSMSAYFETVNMKGMANWMRIQAQEEMAHVMKFYGFINDRGGKVVLMQVDAPKTAWKSPIDVFKEAYKHECYVSGEIHKLVDLALKVSDHPANTFLQWFVTEQVEEEATAQEIVDKLNLVGDNNAALYMLDTELGTRVFTAPV